MTAETPADLDRLRAAAHEMLETQLGHNPALLAAAKAQMDEQIAANPEAFRQKIDNSPQGKIRQYYADAAAVDNKTKDSQYRAVTDALDCQFAKDDDDVSSAFSSTNLPNQQFIAVDLAAGAAYWTSQWALRYPSLTWYPTDTSEAVETFTRPCLQHLVEQQEQSQSQSIVLCYDCRGNALYARDYVVLHGLKTVKFNGKQGILWEADPKVEGRFAVHLSPEQGGKNAKPISFKAENLLRRDDMSSVQELYRGLRERACVLDLLDDKNTWMPLLLEQKMNGQQPCAVLVTCTNLLTEIGHREPLVWQRVMKVACSLLRRGGFLLHGDADGWGSFGDIDAVIQYAQEWGLTLQTHTRNEAWVLYVWKKE
eukprot:scaffold1695_cov167-Amphora_coffeaeformis.AAC.23